MKNDRYRTKGKNKFKNIFEVEEMESEFGSKYNIIYPEENAEGILRTYRLEEEYQVLILKSKEQTSSVLLFPNTDSDVIGILYCTGGEMSFFSKKEDKKYFLKKDDILIYNRKNKKEIVENYEFKSNNFENILIFLHVKRLKSKLSQKVDIKKFVEWENRILSMFEENSICYADSNSKVKLLANRIKNMSIENIREYMEFKEKISYFIFLVLEMKIQSLEKVGFEDIEIAQRIKKYIDKSPVFKSLTNQEISEKFKISNYRMQKIFMKIEKLTTSQYVQKKRMDYSKELLINTNKGILDIAYEIGYENPSKFSKAFKKTFGILPSKYRKKKKRNTKSL